MTVIWAGLALGAIYAITAVVYNITIATSGIFNFAASQYVMVGAFVGFVTTGILGLPWLLSVPTAAIIGGAIGYLTELTAIRPLKDKSGWAVLVTTVGVSVALEGIVYVVWGTDARQVLPPWNDASVTLLGGTLAPSDILIFALAVLICVAGQFIHRRTRWGLRGRALTDDRVAASVRGVNARAMAWGSFVIAGALGGAVGPVIAIKTYAVYSLGVSLVVFAFVALTLGGFGSYIGALVGGIVVGLVQALTERYVGAGSSLIIVFVLLLVVLLVRPTGIFGDRRIRLV